MGKIAYCLMAAVAPLLVLTAETVTSLRGDDNLHSKLVEASFNGNDYWSSHDVPQAGNDYVSTHLVRTPNQSGGSWTFPGDSLEIRGAPLWMKGTGTITFGGSLSFTGRSGYLGNWGASGPLTLQAATTIALAPAEGWAFGFYPAGDVNAYNTERAMCLLAAPRITAPTTSSIYVSENAKVTNADGYQLFRLFFVGDCSDYLGAIDLRKGGRLTLQGTVAESAFPATVAVQEGGGFYVSRSISRTRMTLAGGALEALSADADLGFDTFAYQGGPIKLKLNVRTGAASTLSVGGTFTHAVGAKLPLEIDCSGTVSTNLDFMAFEPVLVVPTASGLTPDDVALSFSSATVFAIPGLPNFQLAASDAGGLRTFRLTARNVAVLKTGDANGKSSLYANSGPCNWSTGAFPSDDYDYLVPNGLTARTAAGSFPSIVFSGHSLVLDGGTLGMKGPIVVSDLRTCRTGTINPTITSYGALTNRLSGGKLTLNAYTVVGAAPFSDKWSGSWGLSNGGVPTVLLPRYTYIDSTLCGTQELSVRLNGSNKDEDFQLPNYIELTADNSKTFTGPIDVMSMYKPYYGSVITNDDLASVLVIRDARNLGGRLANFSYGALTFQRGALWVRETLAIDDVNRGICVNDGGARFIVDEGKTLTVRSQVTQRGPIWKQGAGTLVLAGPVRFNSVAGLVPSAGTNDLVVKVGAIKPATTNSYDGFRIAFAPGARLALDAEPADAGVAACGLYDVLLAQGQASPFDLAATGGKLPVSIDGDADRVVRRVALCTVAAAAPDLSESFSITHPYASYGCSVTREVRADGAVTYWAEFCRGTVILFR